MQLETHSAEVIVIGTGVGGLAAAKTYLELSPQTDLVLIEKVRPTKIDNNPARKHANILLSDLPLEASGRRKTAMRVSKLTISMAHTSLRTFLWTQSTA